MLGGSTSDAQSPTFMCPSCELGIIRASMHLCRGAAYGADGLRGLEGKHAECAAGGSAGACAVAQSYAQH